MPCLQEEEEEEEETSVGVPTLASEICDWAWRERCEWIAAWPGDVCDVAAWADDAGALTHRERATLRTVVKVHGSRSDSMGRIVAFECEIRHPCCRGWTLPIVLPAKWAYAVHEIKAKQKWRQQLVFPTYAKAVAHYVAEAREHEWVMRELKSVMLELKWVMLEDFVNAWAVEKEHAGLMDKALVPMRTRVAELEKEETMVIMELKRAKEPWHPGQGRCEPSEETFASIARNQEWLAKRIADVKADMQKACEVGPTFFVKAYDDDARTHPLVEINDTLVTRWMRKANGA